MTGGPRSDTRRPRSGGIRLALALHTATARLAARSTLAKRLVTCLLLAALLGGCSNRCRGLHQAAQQSAVMADEAEAALEANPKSPVRQLHYRQAKGRADKAMTDWNAAGCRPEDAVDGPP